MVEISLSGSGEGPGKATTRGYSTISRCCVFLPLNSSLWRSVGGFASTVVSRAGFLWEVISGRRRSGVRVSCIPADTCGLSSRSESITSHSAMRACAISLLSRNVPVRSLTFPRVGESRMRRRQESRNCQIEIIRKPPYEPSFGICWSLVTTVSRHACEGRSENRILNLADWPLRARVFVVWNTVTCV